MPTGQDTTSTAAVVGLIVLLAGLDFVGAVLAKEWTEQRAAWQLAGSALAFAALFVVFVVGLRYTELTILTFGWIVVLQTGVVMIDWARYGMALSPGRWAAIIAIVALQGYLVLGASAAEPATEHEASASRPPSVDLLIEPRHGP